MAVQTAGKLLRVRQVAAKLGCGVSTIWMWRAQGRFPDPIHLGDNRRVAAWPENIVDDWVQTRARADRGDEVTTAA
jgi:predicted DNA-binding transcriptional regulator AlpA